MAQTRRYCLRPRPFDLMPLMRLLLLDISSIYIAPLSLFNSRAVRGSCAYLPLSLAFAMPRTSYEVDWYAIRSTQALPFSFPMCVQPSSTRKDFPPVAADVHSIGRRLPMS